MKGLVIAVGLILGVQASAQEVNPQTVRACFANAGPGERAPVCLGQAANACQAGGNDTTLGITACIQSETQVWDQLLNEEYKAVRSILGQQDAALKDRLRDAQRAWIAFRDAECSLEYARWQGGSIRNIVAANCMMGMTAQRSIALRDKRGF